MKITNRELMQIGIILNQIANQPLKGSLKFKFLKLRKSIQNTLSPLQEMADTSTDDEMEEILALEQDVDIELLRMEDLEPIDLSLNQLQVLLAIVEEESEGQENV